MGVLLAAGAASRYGGDKLLSLLPDGTPLALQSARRLRHALPSCTVVVRENDSAMTSLLQAEGLHIVINPNAAGGMGASIACAIGACRDADGWVIALADMPFIEPETIAGVAQNITQDDAIVVPTYASRPGHPVGFGRGYFNDLAALGGDAGARGIVGKYQNKIRFFSTTDKGIHQDIDYPSDRV